MLGKFVIAAIPFAEGDGRYKVRPALVLAQRKMGDQTYYLVAPKYSASEKVRGDNEVVLSVEESILLGLDKEGVVRLSKGNLAAISESGVIRVLQHYKRLPALKAKSLQLAAKKLGCAI